MKIALVSCAKSKQDYACKANEMYMPSDLFKYSYDYAKTVADQVYILSAKHGLLSENSIIDPYELALKTMKSKEKQVWSKNVIMQMKTKFDLENDEFIILAGKDYHQYLLSELNNYQLPLGNRRYGERISYLMKLLNKEADCFTLHKLFAGAKRYSHDQIDTIPFKNGIYIVFEKGEIYNGVDRIVRVGTHDSEDRLKARLKDHFVRENKDGSIFRKNIGKAILNKKNDSYLDIWTMDTSKSENRIFINKKKQSDIEKEVSEYLRENFSIMCFQVDDKEQRLKLEKGIIATLNSQSDFDSSENWLGGHSTVNKLRDSGLWLTIGLDAEVLTSDEMKQIKNSVRGVAPTETLQVKQQQPIVKATKKISSAKTTTDDIRSFLFKKLKKAKDSGLDSLTIKAGDIGREIPLNKRPMMICAAMRDVPGFANYDVIYKPPKGNGPRLEHKYFFQRDEL
ncbi:DUF6884 domain-containing protein [Acetobacterium bakii]|uniref:DUF6884 domain-containing protein n=1 Tax=Acetobacterium bakii TaxID=52689 RepID=UPI0006816AF5|nr:DUF6884 domain-containing protein [Acetobacterium bakii]